MFFVSCIVAFFSFGTSMFSIYEVFLLNYAY